MLNRRPEELRDTQEIGMEALVALFAVVTPWLILDILAGTHGSDSRDPYPDDHKR
jgi:hypothetical protein